MKHIHLFNTGSEYKNKKVYLDYPSVSYIQENEERGGDINYKKDNPTFFLEYHWDESWTMEDTLQLFGLEGMFFTAVDGNTCGGGALTKDLHPDLISFNVNGIDTILGLEKKTVEVKALISENNTLNFTEESILEKKRIKSLRLKFSKKPERIYVIIIMNEGSGESVLELVSLTLDQSGLDAYGGNKISDLEYEFGWGKFLYAINSYNLIYSGEDYESIAPEGYLKTVIVGTSKDFEEFTDLEEQVNDHNSYGTTLDIEYEGSIENGRLKIFNKPYKVDLELKQDCSDQALVSRFKNMLVSNAVLTGKFKNPDLMTYNMFSSAKFLECVDMSNTNLTTFYRTFNDCRALKSVKLPKSTKEVIGFCFYNARSLTEIYCYAEIAPSISSSNGMSSEGTLYYPKGSDYSTWLEAFGEGWTGVEIDV